MEKQTVEEQQGKNVGGAGGTKSHHYFEGLNVG